MRSPNPTKDMLENLEHHVIDLISGTMYSILDNGDRPDKRIDAIVGLHLVKRSILEKLDKVTASIPDAP